MRMSVLMRTGTLETLSAAYQRVHGERVSRSMVSQYFKELGYKFKKARKVLTSPDPEHGGNDQNAWTRARSPETLGGATPSNEWARAC
jgi:transposase